MAMGRKPSRLTRRLVLAAQERFHACEVCHQSEAFDSIEDALRPLRLRLGESRRLLRGLTCPNCASRISSGMLVVTPTPEQNLQARLSKKFDILYRGELQDFREFLIRYPMLGAEHKFGKLLSKAMKRAKRTVLEPAGWYRATRYTANPRFAPRAQHEATRANRYNQIGQVAWYVASDEKTAAVEVLREPQSGQRVCIARINLTESIFVLDLRSVIWGEDPTKQWILRNVVDLRFISEPASLDEVTRPEYRIPQFVADMARQRKLRGILYDSTRPSAYNNPEAVGHNLVLFDPIPAHIVISEKVVEFGEPDNDPFGLERWPLRTCE